MRESGGRRGGGRAAPHTLTFLPPFHTDNPGGYCPRTSSLLQGEVQTNVNGFLPGAGKLSFPVGGSGAPLDKNLFISVFGVCRQTGNSFAMVCCSGSLDGGHCPGTGTPGLPTGGSLLYVPNGTGCKTQGDRITGGNTYNDGACQQCTLNV